MSNGYARIALALMPLLAAPASHGACWTATDAQARIARLDSDMNAREPYTGKPQSAAKLAYYRQQIEQERELIQQQTEVSCVQVVDAAHPAQVPCPDARPAK